jgi:hypothetical protein
MALRLSRLARQGRPEGAVLELEDPEAQTIIAAVAAVAVLDREGVVRDLEISSDSQLHSE